MSVKPNDSVVQSQVSSSAGDQVPEDSNSVNNPSLDDSNPSPENQQDKVSYETHKRLLKQKKDTELQLAKLLEEKRLRDENEAKKQGDYEKLLKMREQELEQIRNENQKFKSHLTNARKLESFLKTAGVELEDKWLNLVPLENIVIKDDENEVDPFSVKQVVDNFKKSWPEAFQARPRGMPAIESPNGFALIPESEWKKLPAKELKKYKPNQIQWGK